MAKNRRRTASVPASASAFPIVAGCGKTKGNKEDVRSCSSFVGFGVDAHLESQPARIDRCVAKKSKDDVEREA